MRKIFIGVAAAAVIAAPLAATTSANAAGGDEYVQPVGFGDAPANALPDGSSTEFTPANLSLFGEWANVGKGTMYDPGTFTVASNPASLHEFWAPFHGDDQMMIVNGHTDGTHTVWKQTVDTSAAPPSSTTTLWAGQNENVGTVTVSPDPVNAGKFCVKYDLSDQAVADGYGITQVYVASGADATAI